MFYDVWFNGIRSSFLYPDFCVLSSEPQPIRFRDECGEVQRSLEQFSEALTSGKHTICGELCNFYPADPSAVGIPVFSECSRRKAIPKTTAGGAMQLRGLLMTRQVGILHRKRAIFLIHMLLPQRILDLNQSVDGPSTSIDRVQCLSRRS
ncbi:unnamed protein product [Nippostrongylus brasiliensis]|uniref:Uncharacterized protein n=1 Tax=Nippostrongylus brasiliensis TaxID=27835 RepID=A0A158R241_NIPBR|nr:unnamed protein product [Nippostrongylus brasiliensis]